MAPRPNPADTASLDPASETETVGSVSSPPIAVRPDTTIAMNMDPMLAGLDEMMVRFNAVDKENAPPSPVAMTAEHDAVLEAVIAQPRATVFPKPAHEPEALGRWSRRGSSSASTRAPGLSKVAAPADPRRVHRQRNDPR